VAFVLTPCIIFVTSYISLSEIQEENFEFGQKWGSLFDEFKNDRGFWSSQYYFIYFLRRLAYVLGQVFLNSNLYLQGALNILGSLISFLFLIWFRPFKDFPVFVSNFLGEVCILVVVILTYMFLWKVEENLALFIEKFVIFSVIAVMAAQFILSLFIFFRTLLGIWRKLEKERSLAFVNRAEKTIAFN
jgi:hypothetical protein